MFSLKDNFSNMEKEGGYPWCYPRISNSRNFHEMRIFARFALIFQLETWKISAEILDIVTILLIFSKTKKKLWNITTYPTFNEHQF